MFNRRQFVGALGASSLASLLPFKAMAANPRVIVVGGGMAGVTAAKYIRLWSGKTIDVTLVTPATTYVSNIMSNLVVTGQVSYSTLQFSYANLTSKYGVTVVTGTVTGVTGYGDSSTGSVTVSGQRSPLVSERLVLAPGITIDEVTLTGGTSGQTIPVLHAWQAGAQTTALQTLLKNMPAAGGAFVLTIPPKPYRCPPGPYERACVIADYLKRNKPGAKIYVLDANPDITAEPENFRAAFTAYHMAGVLDYLPSTSVVSVSSSATSGKDQTVTINTASTINAIGASTTGTRALFGNVMNIIPPHRAPDVVKNAGVVPLGARFAPVDVRTFESLASGRKGIYVIGDASDTTLPKAGHVANQEAKICANAIVSAFKGLPIEQSPTANSACFSPINSTQASWLTAVYQYRTVDKNNLPIADLNKRFVIWDDTLTGTAKYAGATEASAPSTGNFSRMQTWYKVLMAETFS